MVPFLGLSMDFARCCAESVGVIWSYRWFVIALAWAPTSPSFFIAYYNMLQVVSHILEAETLPFFRVLEVENPPFIPLVLPIENVDSYNFL